MKLGKGQLEQLEARCDTALRRRNFREQIKAMGNYINIDPETLPQPLRRKWRKVLSSLALKTFTG